MLVACVSIPRFAVEVERQRRRDIGSRLILIGEGTVFDCSLGADASGVRRGMRMSEAIGLCQRAVVMAPDGPYYRRRSDEVLDFLGELSPVVEDGGLGMAYLSLRGLPVGPERFAEELIAALHGRLGFMASVGIANGKFASRVAGCTTRPGATKVVPPGEEAGFLAPLAVDHLPVEEAMRWRLRLLGLETMGDIARLPLGAFQSQFGLEGKRWWELAQGTDSEPLAPRVSEETVVRRLQMPAPAVSLEAILLGVERLVHAAYSDAERGGRWVRKAVVRGSLDDGGSWELPVAFREALASPADAWSAIKGAIVRRPPERPVEELEVELVGLSAESGKQAAMFEGKGRLWRQVHEAVRQLGTQRERPSVGKVIALDPRSRIPERRSAWGELGDV
ncbi:MAG TPA: DNA polymerase Y family protein [Dehalococcoidia bacterium]|jgi:nucleotidyltransferase/DNA polymerase involved in DNA repair|nr:DNA polymerase Y family protein [Dehalococcoidia bacterium]